MLHMRLLCTNKSFLLTYLLTHLLTYLLTAGVQPFHCGLCGVACVRGTRDPRSPRILICLWIVFHFSYAQIQRGNWLSSSSSSINQTFVNQSINQSINQSVALTSGKHTTKWQ